MPDTKSSILFYNTFKSRNSTTNQLPGKNSPRMITTLTVEILTFGHTLLYVGCSIFGSTRKRGPYYCKPSAGNELVLHTSPRHNGQILFLQVNSNLLRLALFI
ncbi:hypothetical protein HanPI659440_Chr13g0510261 [Helianthus annuus]|nr:hypothetical protein HanPI659440_Chr13g0510261 [Helianthus annuus]